MPAFTIAVAGHVARLTLARPEASNALGPEFWATFPGAVRGLDAGGDVRCLVIAAEGRHFCAGMDLAAFAAMPPTESSADREAFARYARELQAALTVLEDARFPVVAAIHGACIGGGLDLAAACDLRFAAAGAYFRIEETNIGMMADLGTLQRLPYLLPEPVVRRMAYLGSTLGADAAASHGFIEAVAPDAAGALAAALGAAATIATKAPLAVAASKAALRYARDHSTADSLAHAALLQGVAWSPGDIRAAIAARAARTDAAFAPLATLRGLAP